MKCIEFSETREERKYYEGKKQKALRYIDHTIEMYKYKISVGFGLEETPVGKEFSKKLTVIRKMVNDI